MRCFIGFFVPDEIKPQIVAAQNRLKHLPVVCKFVEDENLHACISFLGEVSDEDVAKIAVKLENICKNHPKFRINVDGIKLIPNEKYLRVVGLDVSEESGILKTLSSDIKNSIGGDCKPAHITLCRVKNIVDKDKTVEKIKRIETEVDGFGVNSIDLIKSVVSRSGPIYTVVKSCKLA